MSWAIGYDDNWKRDIGYGVPATCDHPFCHEKIDRGLSHVCCNSEPYGGEHGCGRYFCAEHEFPEWNDDGNGEEWRVCGHSNIPEDHISPDLGEWSMHKLKDESWAQWRAENPDEVSNLLWGEVDRKELKGACKVCGDHTIYRFNINFKQVAVCNDCADSITTQQIAWMRQWCPKSAPPEKEK